MFDDSSTQTSKSQIWINNSDYLYQQLYYTSVGFLLF